MNERKEEDKAVRSLREQKDKDESSWKWADTYSVLLDQREQSVRMGEPSVDWKLIYPFTKLATLCALIRLIFLNFIFKIMPLPFSNIFEKEKILTSPCDN